MFVCYEFNTVFVCNDSILFLMLIMLQMDQVPHLTHKVCFCKALLPECSFGGFSSCQKLLKPPIPATAGPGADVE